MMHTLFKYIQRPASIRSIAFGLKRETLRTNESGVALLMVLVVITILTTMVVSFTDTTQKNLQVTQYYKDRLQAYNTAQSGLEVAAAVLKYASVLECRNYDGANCTWHFESEGYQTFVMPLLMIPVCESSVIEPAIPVAQAVEGEENVQMAMLLDENSKLSLFHLFRKNALGTPSEKTNEVTFTRLSFLFEMLLTEKDLVPANQQSAGTTSGPPIPINDSQADRLAGYIVDWIDTENNQAVAPFNIDEAEDHCEDGLPYVTKNGRLDSVDEIGLICGFRQMPRGTIDMLARYLTIYNVATNINTASLSVIKALFYAASTASPDDQAQDAYIELHGDGDEGQPTPVTANLGKWLQQWGITSAADKNNITVQSDYFQVGVYGVLYDMETMTEQARSKVQAVIHRPAGTAGQPAANVQMIYYRED